jgi:hypothetical protein
MSNLVSQDSRSGIRKSNHRALSAPDELSPKQLHFAALYVERGNATAAYREAFDVAPDAAPITVRRKAYEVAHTPKVAAHIRALQAAAADALEINVRDRMADLWAICTADAGEITQVVNECCRGCYAEGGRPWQWVDEAELQRAVERTVASRLGPKPLPMPDPLSGFGFDPQRPANEECVHCSGRGVTRVHITPTDQLSPAARRLFKAARQKADGSIEIELESRQAASEQLAKLAGWNVERSITAHVTVPPLKDISRDDALAFLESIAPTVDNT